MPFARETLSKKIADRLNQLADQLKTRTRANFTDANHSLEFVMVPFFNALFGWKLKNLNVEKRNFPAVDLGDDENRLAMQITNTRDSSKIKDTTVKAIEHRLSGRFARIIIFFLLPEKPGMPRDFKQPADGPRIETWDLASLIDEMMQVEDLGALAAAWEVLEKEMPSPESQHGPLHTLLPRPEGFVGRAVDLEKLRALNPASGAVLTGLRGMGGIGKTALALVLAHEWAARFPDAQIFLDARGTQAEMPGAGALLAQVIQTFHPTAKLPDDETKLKGIYHDVLGGKKVLILLDNARDAAQAAPLIPPAGCGLIVTSRHSFMLGTTAPHDVGRLPDAEAVELLREYHPALGDADATALVKLCAGLPLALRLAGAHLALDATERGGTPDVAAYLQDLRSGRLATLDADAPDAGEITISETLRLSEARLPDAEREAWRKLGVFTASFDAHAATVIAGADETSLARFVRRSLLEREGADRYKLHDLAADYARAQFGDIARTDLHLAHVRHYIAIARIADTLYITGKVLDGLALFDGERAQIEAAYVWLEGRNDELAARQMIALVNAVVDTADLRFHPRQRIVWLESQLAAARRLQDRESEANALGNIGIAHTKLGDAGKAIEFYEQDLDIRRAIGDRRGEGNVLGNLGLARSALGDSRKAITFYEQHRDIARAIGDRRGESNALGNLGVAHSDLGDMRKAIEYYERCFELHRAIGDRHGEAIDLGNLGVVHAEVGDARKAIEFFEKQLTIVRAIGDRRGEGNALWNAALAHDSLGHRAEAIACAGAALAISVAIEHPGTAQLRAKLAEWCVGA